MKFNVKRFAVFIAVIMVASFATAGVILAVTGNLSVAVEQIDESKTFDTKEISNIYINMVSTDINLIPTDEEEIMVRFYGEVSTNRKREIPSLVAYESGGQLVIEILQPKTIFFGINVWRTNLDVYVPEDSIEILTIKAVSSDTSARGLKVDKLNFSAVSGDFKVESIFANDLVFDSTSGDINLVDYTGSVKINTVSGDVVLEDGKQDDNIEVITVSGDVYIKQEDSSNMNIRTTSGDIGISFSEDARFYLKAKTVSGDIENRFPIKITSSGRRDLEGIVGSDEKEINVSTVSGDINVD